MNKRKVISLIESSQDYTIPSIVFEETEIRFEKEKTIILFEWMYVVIMTRGGQILSVCKTTLSAHVVYACVCKAETTKQC